MPQFYFPSGKPVSKAEKQRGEAALDKLFEAAGKTLKFDNFEAFCTDVCEIPKIFKKMAFDALKKSEGLDEKAEEIPKQVVATYYKKVMESLSVKQRVFKLLCGDKDHVAPSDFKPLFRHLLDSHPGLEFLQATPEF